jgi:hypothetical protein
MRQRFDMAYDRGVEIAIRKEPFKRWVGEQAAQPGRMKGLHWG